MVLERNIRSILNVLVGFVGSLRHFKTRRPDCRVTGLYKDQINRGREKETEIEKENREIEKEK